MDAPPPHLFVIFGGAGDLTGRKLLPALRRLSRQDLLGEKWRVLAVGRRAMSDEDYRRWAREALVEDGRGADDLGSWCDRCLGYASVGDGTEDDYRRLRERIEATEDGAGLPGNRTFYLALPPSAFGPTVKGLESAGLAHGPGFTRVVFEKPFGHDLESACALNEEVHAVFSEEQVYRIDHYLGKETVQNLIVFRFGNTIFEDLWNRDRVECVQITVAESLGVEDRAAFYDRTGALRDIVQNHLMQVLSLFAMEVPAAYRADEVRHEKVKVLRSIRSLRAERTVFGRYGPGEIDGASVPGYRDADGVPEDSKTETYFAARLEIDTWRWQGVPFFVRTGKRLPRKLTEIAVVFRRPPVHLFDSMGSCPLNPNVLRIVLQPDEGFSLSLDVKRPGEPLALQRVPLDFRYGEEFGELPDAYETLLLDVLIGDQTLFVHADEVEASWTIFDPVLHGDRDVEDYAAGTWGPEAADRLLARDGQSWRASDG